MSPADLARPLQGDAALDVGNPVDAIVGNVMGASLDVTNTSSADLILFEDAGNSLPDSPAGHRESGWIRSARAPAHRRIARLPTTPDVFPTAISLTQPVGTACVSSPGSRSRIPPTRGDDGGVLPKNRPGRFDPGQSAAEPAAGGPPVGPAPVAFRRRRRQRPHGSVARRAVPQAAPGRRGIPIGPSSGGRCDAASWFLEQFLPGGRLGRTAVAGMRGARVLRRGHVALDLPVDLATRIATIERQDADLAAGTRARGTANARPGGGLASCNWAWPVTVAAEDFRQGCATGTEVTPGGRQPPNFGLRRQQTLVFDEQPRRDAPDPSGRQAARGQHRPRLPRERPHAAPVLGDRQNAVRTHSGADAPDCG